MLKYFLWTNIAILQYCNTTLIKLATSPKTSWACSRWQNRPGWARSALAQYFEFIAKCINPASLARLVVLWVSFAPADDNVDEETPGREEGMGGRPPPWPPPAQSAAHERTDGTSACEMGFYRAFILYSIIWCFFVFWPPE